MKPLISVIVPVYNTVSLLPRCVESLLAQTYENIEILLIDDGSTDGAGSLCAQYASEYESITVIHQENRGVSAARNAGLAAASGSYFGFVDSDDWIQPEMYGALIDTIEQQGTQLAACGYAIHRYDGTVINNMVDPATPPLLERDQALESLIHYQGIQGFLCNKLFKAELLAKAGGVQPLRLDEHIHVCEDLLFVSRCIEIVECIAYDNRPFYIYCVRDYGGVENYNRDKRLSELYALEQLVESWGRLSPELAMKMKRKFTHDAYFILRAAADAGDREYIPVLRRYLRRYMGPFLRSKAVKPVRKARVLLTLILPNFENSVKAILHRYKLFAGNAL